jgi:hypothetical protein
MLIDILAREAVKVLIAEHARLRARDDSSQETGSVVKPCRGNSRRHAHKEKKSPAPYVTKIKSWLIAQSVPK